MLRVFVAISVFFSIFQSIGIFIMLIEITPNVKRKWVDSNFQLIDLLAPPLAAGVTGTLILVHIVILLHYNIGCM